MIEISCEQLELVERLLAGVPNGVPRALASALNRGASRGKTSAIRRVKGVYTVQPSALTANSRITLKSASAGSLEATVTFGGSKIPLNKFQVSPKSPGGRYTVIAAGKRGGGAVLPHAFIANLSNTGGVYERIAKPRFPVEEKMGLSTGQMVGSQEVSSGLEDEVSEVVNQRIEHEVARLLAGYGG